MSSYKILKLYFTNYNRDETNIIKASTIFGLNSTPPKNVLRIHLDKEFARETYQEAIVAALYSQGTDITARTWRRLIRFLELDPDYWVRRNNQIKLEVLLIVVKVNHKEFFQNELMADFNIDSAVSYSISNMISNLVESLMSENLNFQNIESTDDGIKTARIIKNFLSKSLIIQGLEKGLSSVFDVNSLCSNWIKEEVKKMTIYTTNYLPPLYGSTLSDGILLIPDTNLFMFNEWPTHRQVAILTLAYHETTHYLARSLANDFNFLSPYYSRPNNSYREDNIIASKPLELGRAAELALFGFQPFWHWPRNHYGTEGKIADAAAEEFLNRINTCQTLPIFTKVERESFQIKEREFPSISLGAELLFTVKENALID